jgi:PIN domain nuclease of toxin-antitoxin system
MQSHDHYLLDTCAWIDVFAAPELLKPSIRKLMNSQCVIHIAAISLLEIARKEATGQLILGIPLADWFKIALPADKVKIIDLSPEISIDATRLPEWDYKDPCDRIVVATARIHRFTILTSDRNILKYPRVKSLASRK